MKANDRKNTQNNYEFVTYNFIVISRLRDERGEEERGNESNDGKLRGQSPRASPNGHSPILNLSKSGNEQNSVGAASERSELHSPNPSIREDEEDNLSEGNVSEVDEQNDKDDDGSYSISFSLSLISKPLGS